MKKNVLQLGLAFILAVITNIANAQLLLNEQFDYGLTSGSLSTIAPIWITQGVASPLVGYSTTNLTFSGYPSSLGGSASFGTSGEDVNRPFGTTVTSGVVYSSCIISVSAASAAGDYFFHFAPVSSTSTTDFKGRVFARSTVGGYNLGISKAGAVALAKFSSKVLAFNTSYVLILKYTIVAGATNDIADLIIIDGAIPSVEPTVDATAGDPAGVDITGGVGAVALRQGGASTAPTLLLDGLRVANTYYEALSIPFPEASITGFQFANQSGLTGASIGTTITGHSINVMVPYGSALSSLIPSISLTRSTTISPATTSGVDFSSTVQYTIDGTNIYDVNVSIGLFTEKEIKTFNILGYNASISGTNVNVTVPFEADLSSTIVPSGTLSILATVNPAFSVAQDFNSTVNYTVTAQDLSTQVYAVSITRAPASSAKEITSFKFLEWANDVYGASISGSTINVLLPYNTDLSSLTPSFTGSAFATVTGLTTDFSSPLTITVTAQDMSTQEFTVNVQSTTLTTVGYIRSSLNSAGSVTLTDKLFTLEGQIIGNNVGAASAANVQFSLVDETAGLTIRATNYTVVSSESVAQLAEGKLATITGYFVNEGTGIGNYNGFLQMRIAVVHHVSEVQPLKIPTLVTAITEINESDLITFIADTINVSTWNNAATGNFNVAFTTAGISYTMRMLTTATELWGKSYATVFGNASNNKNITITGIGSQFDGTDPADQGYQILPYRISGIDYPGKYDPISITGFDIVNGLTTISGSTIYVLLPANTPVTSLAPSIALSGVGSTSPANGSAVDFTSGVVYTVTSQFGTNSFYEVSVYAPFINTESNILSYVYLPQPEKGLITTITGTISGSNISVVLPAGVTISGLVPTIVISDDATSSPSLGIAPNYFADNDSTYFASYSITAADGESNSIYQVSILIETAVETRISTFANPSVGIYPNPTSSAVTLSVLKGSEVEIYSAMGLKSHSLKLAAGSSTVDVSGLSKGLYFVKIKGTNFVSRFVIE